MRVLVTGGGGFIGSHLVLRLFDSPSCTQILNVDKLTYAADLKNLSRLEGHKKSRFAQVCITDAPTLEGVFAEFEPDVVYHLAAESHVDRSISDAADFIRTNLLGTYNMLEAFRRSWDRRGRPASMRFVHVSTDEVYGSLSVGDEPFNESTPYAPNSPYSASKAGSDHLARAWHRTYGAPVMITHCSNNYGPHQYDEKLIPVVIRSALDGRRIPIYGKGLNVRDWLYVGDHVSGLIAACEKGRPGEVYNFGGGTELSNIDLVRRICARLDESKPGPRPYFENVEYVTDRLGHDFRYAIDHAATGKALGWKPSVGFDEGLRETIGWYLEKWA